MLVCSRSIPEITNSIVRAFSIAMSAQTSKAPKKGLQCFISSYMIHVRYDQMKTRPVMWIS